MVKRVSFYCQCCLQTHIADPSAAIESRVARIKARVAELTGGQTMSART